MSPGFLGTYHEAVSFLLQCAINVQLNEKSDAIAA